MENLGLKPIRMLAVAALTLASLMATAPAAQASPGYYPYGPQLNVPISTITGGGWTLCWSGTYDNGEDLATVQENCNKKYLLLAGGEVDASSYMLAAAGERTSVFAPTGYNATTLNNGTYWYFNTDQSMGFASVDDIYQNSADVQASGLYGGTDVDATSQYRLTWHLDGTSMDPGWRIGETTMLNEGSGYVRAIYESDGAPSQPQLVVDALNMSGVVGQAIAPATRVLGLMGTDTVTNIVLEYEGTNIWGEHVGPTTTMPAQAGTYTVNVKSYTLTAADPTVYWQSKHGATLTIRWVELPITDPALVGSASAPSALAPTYGKRGAVATGTGWSVSVLGAPASAGGGTLLTDPGSALTVVGKGFKPYSAVRVYFLSDPVELGSVWTDAVGSFTKVVTVPTATAGLHTLQVNGYGLDGKVRTVNAALTVGTTRKLSDTVLFNKGSAELKASITARIQRMVMSVPTDPWTVHLYVSAAAASQTASAIKLATDRAQKVADQVRSLLEAAGVTVVVETTIWHQPGLVTSDPRQLRLVYIDLIW
jgi:hypothetical protein